MEVKIGKNWTGPNRSEGARERKIYSTLYGVTDHNRSKVKVFKKTAETEFEGHNPKNQGLGKKIGGGIKKGR